MRKIFTMLAVVFFVAGCSPEIGSSDWCNDMKEKPKGDWSANEASNFAQHCVF